MSVKKAELMDLKEYIDTPARAKEWCLKKWDFIRKLPPGLWRNEIREKLLDAYPEFISLKDSDYCGYCYFFCYVGDNDDDWVTPIKYPITLLPLGEALCQSCPLWPDVCKNNITDLTQYQEKPLYWRWRSYTYPLPQIAEQIYRAIKTRPAIKKPDKAE